MNKEVKKIIVILLFGLGTTYFAQAQIATQKIGQNPMNMHASAVLEVEHNRKGVLFPRVALTGLEDRTTIASPANALTVFNTAKAGTAPNEVTAGYYYWNATGSKWVKLLSQEDVVASDTGGPWNKQGTTTSATLNTEDIYQMGSLAIGATTILPVVIGTTSIQPKLHIEGDVSTTGKYYTTNSMYADYVFEKYFNGSSTINEAYEFKSLADVKDFVKKNNHLPGVTPIGDLTKTTTGYTFDMTELAIQSLEKIEELYLHVIEQEEELGQQRTEIVFLKKEMDETKERLEKLEAVKK
ncbi:hypothetical protein [Myroides odoratus]|uniref:Peptidase S74 domain-containing protein n=1 Tax=Myroides odoratus TaxID=256 RepID=A0A9Q6ZC33_MYROD|nr:hypothetical protein [Myroides odoratus]EHQ43595.1 hypothetical protein Myrod_2774 [Myroides odoratus DSM 2801]EKB04149.1 hypothetical protein HMPREF9716_03325 [Myroides odoratus CIP 103059]QQU00915.1 hypothetical protein I6I88_03955 [Myroides odoratus]WQD56835.1 hypothetical protein U0010_15070 [Myroides odoratus]STZ30871.1 Uncharacterised protein [Myroides odoratus]